MTTQARSQHPARRLSIASETPPSSCIRRRRRVSPRSLALMTRQLSVMVDAGLPLVQSLDLLAREEPDRRLAGAIAGVRADVERGVSLTDAMRARPDVFDELYTSMVAA